MNNNEMLEIVKCQLAIDYNCNVEDFLKMELLSQKLLNKKEEESCLLLNLDVK